MTHAQTLAAKIRRQEWEPVALALLLALGDAARRLPPATVDDLLALISAEEKEDERGS
jgi:hypothetical protein